jgi:hypothetical protein
MQLMGDLCLRCCSLRLGDRRDSVPQWLWWLSAACVLPACSLLLWGGSSCSSLSTCLTCCDAMGSVMLWVLLVKHGTWMLPLSWHGSCQSMTPVKVPTELCCA